MLQNFSRYNNWANSLVLDALEGAFATHAPLSDYCISLLSHIANAQVIWTSRIRGVVPDVTVWQVHELDMCRTMLLESGCVLQEIVEADNSLHDIISYKNSTGQAFETSVSDILLHVFNHGTYHRAQIVKEMKAQGMKPVVTDYIQFVRSRGLES